MKDHFTVSPDFTPEHIPGWFIFNTWMQKALSEVIHLELYDNFESQRKAIQSNEIDIIYANPYDAAFLVREKKFAPLVKPTGKSDEAIIAVHESSPFTCVEDLQPGTRISRTDDPDVNMMSMIMLEPAELDKQNTQSCTRDTYILVSSSFISVQPSKPRLSSTAGEEEDISVNAVRSVSVNGCIRGPTNSE